MQHLWDEVAKSLAESVPRRESLRRLGALFAGAVLAPLGVQTAWGAKPAPDPCKEFCRGCGGKANRNRCLAECRECGGVTSNVCGSCGSHVCTNRATDESNCGACGNVCPSPPNANAVCDGGVCDYACYPGYEDCGGACSDLTSDAAHCGACENACETGDYCCSGDCSDLSADPNCGACGLVCADYGPDYACCNGGCTYLLNDPNNCSDCGIACTGGTPYCVNGGCRECEYDGYANCGDGCVDTYYDPSNCGGCGIVCNSGNCDGGVCSECPYCQADCAGDDICVDICYSDTNCGACGNDCTADGLSCCGYCTDLLSDPYNCGYCGNYCYPEDGGYCDGGVCFYPF